MIVVVVDGSGIFIFQFSWWPVDEFYSQHFQGIFFNSYSLFSFQRHAVDALAFSCCYFAFCLFAFRICATTNENIDLSAPLWAFCRIFEQFATFLRVGVRVCLFLYTFHPQFICYLFT